MLAELKEQAQLADELGYDSISFTEHHFHVEGFEISNNPVLLDLFIAMQHEAHPRRPARHRAAGAEPAARRRGHRDARPHDAAAARTPASRAATSAAGST